MACKSQFFSIFKVSWIFKSLVGILELPEVEHGRTEFVRVCLRVAEYAGGLKWAGKQNRTFEHRKEGAGKTNIQTLLTLSTTEGLIVDAKTDEHRVV